MSYVSDLKNYPQGHYFYNNAIKLGNEFDTDAYVEDNGIVRWKSNNNVPPTEILELWQYLNKDFSFENSIKEQQNETLNFLKKYRQQQRKYSQLELFEMQNAFGTGTKVIDVISREIINL